MSKANGKSRTMRMCLSKTWRAERSFLLTSSSSRSLDSPKIYTGCEAWCGTRHERVKEEQQTSKKTLTGDRPSPDSISLSRRSDLSTTQGGQDDQTRGRRCPPRSSNERGRRAARSCCCLNAWSSRGQRWSSGRGPGTGLAICETHNTNQGLLD